MSTIKIRKNFLLDKEIIEKAQSLLAGKHKNLTEAINIYFKAIVKEPSLLNEIERSANKRSGSFIGVLDGKVGNQDFKHMKKDALGKSDR